MAAAGSAARRTTASGFSVSEEAAPRSAGSTGGLRSVGGIDALIALQGVQGVEDPIERRKRAVKRGRLALDALDELKIGLLGGALSTATLSKLQAAAAQLKLGSGHADLDAVLGEIELRVEVELAKMAPREGHFQRSRAPGPGRIQGADPPLSHCGMAPLGGGSGSHIR